MFLIIKKLVAPLVGLNPAGIWSAAKLQSLLLTLTLMVTAFWVGSAAAAEKKMVKDPATGKMVSAPKYGGTIRPVVNFKNEGIDPYFVYSAGFWIGQVNEKLGIGDWAFDRSVFSFNTLYLPPEVLRGQLAESWENPDPLTYVFKLRDGVNWHDKAPVSGRPLNAHDVAYSFNRLLGLSGGEPGLDMVRNLMMNMEWDSITATDDSTVVFKLAAPNLEALKSILIADHNFVVAREVVEQFRDIQDWRNVVGTGPYQLTDVVEGNSWTYTKIDNYWGFDEKFPDNRLPYAGYPQGADGIRFSTVYQHYEFFDLGHYQIAMDYLRQIGIDVEIRLITRAEHLKQAGDFSYLGLRSATYAGEYSGATIPLALYSADASWRPGNINDPLFEQYYGNALAATTVEEQREWLRKADLRVAEMLWLVRGPIAPLFSATQPWLKGYNGEGDLGSIQRSPIFARLWIDRD